MMAFPVHAKPLQQYLNNLKTEERAVLFEDVEKDPK